MQVDSVRIYYDDQFDQIPWTESQGDIYLKNYFEPFIKEGTKKYISNVNAKCFIIQVNNKFLPGVLSSSSKDCYVSSPYAHYIEYAIAELKTLNFLPLEMVFTIVLKILGLFLRISNFNQSVYVNNWLLSTNLYIDLTTNEVSAINGKLKELYPNRTIIYRSLNEKTNRNLINILEDLSAKKVVSRQVYITDPIEGHYKKKKDYIKDRNFLKRSELIIKEDQFNEADLVNIRYLYNALYLDKYFNLNPQFTLDFFINAQKYNLFSFKLLSKDDNAKAALGYFKRNGVMTTPIFGFDTQAPTKEGLYRIISSLLMRDSEDKELILNQSSGASNFKSQRGALPFIEYNYIINDHCSFPQRLSWKIVGILLNNIGDFLLKKFKL